MSFLDMMVFKRTSQSALIMLVTTVLITYMALVQGHAMLVVTSGRAKCLTVEVPGRTVIRVSYEAPGTHFFIILHIQDLYAFLSNDLVILS
jgi:hypothetical protein